MLGVFFHVHSINGCFTVLSKTNCSTVFVGIYPAVLLLLSIVKYAAGKCTCLVLVSFHSEEAKPLDAKCFILDNIHM